MDGCHGILYWGDALLVSFFFLYSVYSYAPTSWFDRFSRITVVSSLERSTGVSPS